MDSHDEKDNLNGNPILDEAADRLGRILLEMILASVEMDPESKE